jgi:hypothetical protein
MGTTFLITLVLFGILSLPFFIGAALFMLHFGKDVES